MRDNFGGSLAVTLVSPTEDDSRPRVEILATDYRGKKTELDITLEEWGGGDPGSCVEVRAILVGRDAPSAKLEVVQR